MDRLQAMKVFTRVVETGSFTRASDTLDLPRASVTVIIQQLEAHLKVRLLQRTTRRINLTPDGAAYYERCVRVLADIDEMEAQLVQARGTARGRLRIDMPSALGRLLIMPRMAEFHARHPEIELMLGFGDKPVDLIHEGVDCAIRIGTLDDSTLVARRVGAYQAITAASPKYLQRYGMPASLADLERHVAVNYFWAGTGRLMEFEFLVDGSPAQVRMRGEMAVNDADAYLSAALEGIGLAQASQYMALPYLKSGRLVEVLPQWRPRPVPISAVYPHSRHLSLTVRVFVDWIAELFGGYSLFAVPGSDVGRIGSESGSEPESDPLASLALLDT